jgi:hypothetical protein
LYKDDKSKGIDKFDLQNIYTSAKNLTTDYDYEIILLVKNRKAVKDKIKSAIRQYIAEEASEVFGVDDLLHSLNKIYDYIKEKKETPIITADDLFSILGRDKPVKPILSLRLHQEIAVQKISSAIRTFNEHGGHNKFLVGILPRGGKTYIAGGIIREVKPQRVVVLLGAMSETLEQFKKDLFEHFQDFSDYTIINVRAESREFAIDVTKKYIFVMSIELYKMEHTTRKLLKDLKSGAATKADLFICDEAHLKQVTALADVEMRKGTEADSESALRQVDSIISKAVPVVYMTGTYMRPLTAFRIPPENVVIWDYQDLQNGKKLEENDTYFRELYGELYTNALRKLFSYGETIESIASVYKKFPDLHLLTTQFTDEARAAFSTDGLGRGFSTIEQLFRLKKGFAVTAGDPPHTWANGFQDLRGVMRLINYLSPIDSQIRSIEGEEIEHTGSVIRSIDKISQRVGDRLGHISSDFVVHTQIWFMAHSADRLVNRMPALASAIFRNKWFRKNFVILAVSDIGFRPDRIEIPSIDEPGSIGTLLFTCPTPAKSLKQCIIDEEAAARRLNKGLLILAQNMLQVGISLPCADVVVLLDTGDNVDERIQKMFRALTESPMKKAGFIVDMNYFRSVKAIMDYQITALKVKKGKRILTSQEKANEFNKFLDLYAIDDDKPILRTAIESATIPELETLIEREGVGGKKLEDVGGAINRNIESVLDSEYSRMYNIFLGRIEEERARVLREEGTGVRRAAEEEGGAGAGAGADAEEEAPPPIPKLFDESLNETKKKEAFLDIFRTILKMGVFTTDNPTVEDLQEFISSNEEFRDIIYDTLAKRGDIIIPATEEEIEEQKRFLFEDIIIPNLQKIVSSGKGDSYIAMKQQFNRSDDMNQKIDDVLKYINAHLAPKDKERHQHGEVFTPLTLVDEMLSTLPGSVWSNPDLKWLDPANGMGNFPIKALLGQNEGEFTYVGLLEGLRSRIPDDAERCKYIIEEMLYMVDINGKNNAIARKLFEKLCPDATPNIERIDRRHGFLAEKPLIFNGKTVDKFDIIMGNPPYQGGAVKSIGTRATRKMREETGLTTDLNKNLWIPFTKKALTILNENGFLLFIHPIGWFKPDGLKPHTELRRMMLSKQIVKMKIYDQSQSLKEFGDAGKIAVSYYLLENREPYTKTTITNILNIDEEVMLNTESIIIRAYTNILSKIIKKCPLWKDTSDYKQLSLGKKDCVEGGPYKNIQKIGNDGYIYIIRSSKKLETYASPKIYVDGYHYPRYFYDKTGEYGIIDQNQHYLVGGNLDKQEAYFKTKLSALLLKYVKYRQEFIEPRYYPDMREIPLDEITDETLAEYFGFTREERDAIIAIAYPTREYNFKEITCAELNREKARATTPRNVTRKKGRGSTRA